MLKYLLKTEKGRNKPRPCTRLVECSTTMLHAMFIRGNGLMLRCVLLPPTRLGTFYTKESMQNPPTLFFRDCLAGKGPRLLEHVPLGILRLNQKQSVLRIEHGLENRTWASHGKPPLIYCYIKAQLTVKPNNIRKLQRAQY